MLDIVELSRLQFALTAMYHFLFVPLTLGMAFLLAIMETVYVLSGKQIYKDMTKFWGKLFGINFALGVATGLTMEFQFGTNWSYYSHYVGDIFGAPLAIEGLMAFFLESTFVGLFFFGWDRLGKVQHMCVTWLVALGSYEMGDVQKTKLAAIEAEWETQPAPAAFTLFGIPDQEEETNKFAIQIPYALGIIATRSVDTPVIGLKELMVQHEERIRNGMKAYSLLEQLRSGSTDQAVRDQFNSMKKDLGYGLLLKRYTPNVADATEAQIQQATKDSIPRVAPLYFAFRIMVACGFLLLAIIALSFWSVIRNRIGEKKWLLRAALYGIPLPWIAVEAGWFVAEYGRQPWAIGEVLPTAVANSSLTAGDLIFSMVLICGLYTLFLVAELFLMFKFARLGPSSLKTGRYHFEQSSTTTQPAR